MKNIATRFLVIVLLLFSFQQANAEGLKELANGTTNYPQTNFRNPVFGGNWAGNGAPVQLRLNIYIKDPTSELIYLGFQTSGVNYIIYNPNGVAVFTATTNPNCTSAAMAIAGPTPVVGATGYTP